MSDKNPWWLSRWLWVGIPAIVVQALALWFMHMGWYGN